MRVVVCDGDEDVAICQTTRRRRSIVGGTIATLIDEAAGSVLGQHGWTTMYEI